MRNCLWSAAFTIAFSLGLLAGPASGTYRESGGEFSIGYAIADRSEDGSVRILLTRQDPAVAHRDHHLDRLEALGEAAEGGYLMLEPTADGDHFNVTVSVDELSFGGGGQYESEIEFSDSGAGGNINSDVLTGGHLQVTFEAEFLPARRKQEDLPADGGPPGAILLEQMQAVASGDREAILRTLNAEQQSQFNQMSAEEQAEALSFLVDLTPRNVRITGGSLYDGYAIVEFSGEAEGSPVTGRALVALDGEEWRIVEVSTQF